ncbi:unnamed protein product [Bursaphelenchus xylophilus]|uniref:(pine wood nematode) hypothetical protein n=1 Tax=Bursaphelenchus xylophilus TaxID=6326 RepID=A0A1I7SKX8_BURXY|nr:unnamed protein product [Bursaphelenchus xylophilus]CAG9129289.1 unnamed protein product [Bursaphelenchus xylophilus]
MSPERLLSLYTLLLECADLNKRFSPAKPTSLEIWNFEYDSAKEKLILNKMGSEKKLIPEEKFEIKGASKVKIGLFESGNDVVWGGTVTIGNDNYFTLTTGPTETRMYADSALYLLWSHDRALQLACKTNMFTHFLSLIGVAQEAVTQDFLKCEDSVAIREDQGRLLYKAGRNCRVVNISNPIKWEMTTKECDDAAESKFDLQADGHTTFYSLTYLQLTTTCQIDTDGIDLDNTHIKFFNSASEANNTLTTTASAPLLDGWMVYALGISNGLLLLIVVVVVVVVLIRKNKCKPPPKPTLLQKPKFGSSTETDSLQKLGSAAASETSKGSAEKVGKKKNKNEKQKGAGKLKKGSKDKEKDKKKKEKPEESKAKEKNAEEKKEKNPKSAEKSTKTEETSKEMVTQVMRKHGNKMKLGPNATKEERESFLAMSARVEKIMDEAPGKPRVFSISDGRKYKITTWHHLPHAYTGTLIFECVNVSDLMDTKCLKVHENAAHRDRELEMLMLDTNEEPRRVFPRVIEKVDMNELGWGILMEMLGDKTSSLFRRIRKEGNFQGGFMYMKHMAEALERVHALELVHNNVKPNHFVFDLKKEKFMMVDPRFAHDLKDPGQHRPIEDYDAKNLEFVSRRAMSHRPTQIIDDYESICLIFVAMLFKTTFAEKGDANASEKKKEDFLGGGYASKLKGNGLINLFEFLEQCERKIRQGDEQAFTHEKFREHLRMAAMEHNIDLGAAIKYEANDTKDEGPGYGGPDDDDIGDGAEYNEMINLVDKKSSLSEEEPFS